jgi:hypothetical protein
MHARTLPARHGFLWLLAGFALFRRNPPQLTVLTFSYLILVVVLNLIPLLGPFLLPLVLPALTAMLGNGCRAIERSKGFTLSDLTAGLEKNRVVMVRLGALHLLGSSVLVIAAHFIGTDLSIDPEMSQERAADLLADLSILLALSSPLLMAFWFAPLLTLWDGVSPLKSIFFSFVASWQNWRAFTIYGVAVMLVGMFLPALVLLIGGSISGTLAQVLAMVLRTLLIFVMAPILTASVYLSYRDVFHPPAAHTPEPPRIDVQA